MNIWKDINKERINENNFVACIEISKGGKLKYELDKQTGMLILDRLLYTSTHYPHNYGFIPLTYALDNDPLDVLVLCSEPIQPLCLVRAYPIGVVKMIDNNDSDEKILAICENDPYMNCYHDIADLAPHIMDEIKHFFQVYKQLEGKKTAVTEILGASDAKRIIKECIDRFQEKFGKEK